MDESKARLSGRAGAGKDADGVRREAIPRFELLEATPEERQRRRVTLGAGSIAQVLVIALILWFLTAPSFKEPNIASRLWVQKVTFQPPPPVRKVPRSPRHARVPPTPPLRRQAELPQARPELVVPKPIPPQTAKLQPIHAPHPPKVFVRAPEPKIEVLKPAATKRLLKTHVGGFNTGPVVATARLPRSRVQTGGFGDPHGLPGQAEGGSRGNVPHLGSFNRPEGPGFGNGAGGARGARVLIASAGFGNGYAAGPANDAQDGPVRSAGFANTQSLAQAAPHSKRQAVAAFQPVVITAKPDPIYTKEAQRLHIQGEVILRVIFKASGQLQILGVEHGLGHGLDEAAIRAAERIRFKPARRNGLAVDIPATLHILFQLAE